MNDEDDFMPPKKKRIMYSQKEDDLVRAYFKEDLDKNGKAKTSNCAEFLRKHQTSELLVKRTPQHIQDKVKKIFRQKK